MSNHNENMLEQLKKYFDETPREQIEADWAKTKHLDNVGPTVNEFLANGGRISFDEDIESFEKSIEYSDSESFEETTYTRGFQDGMVSTEAKNYWFEKFEYQKQTKI